MGNNYTIIGFYPDNREPYVGWGTHSSPREAAKAATKKGITVVEVLHGFHKAILLNEELVTEEDFEK